MSVLVSSNHFAVSYVYQINTLYTLNYTMLCVNYILIKAGVGGFFFLCQEVIQYVKDKFDSIP